jgi:hypothetical protein
VRCFDLENCGDGEMEPAARREDRADRLAPVGVLRDGVPLAVTTRLMLKQSYVASSEVFDLGTCTTGRVDLFIVGLNGLDRIEVDLEMGSDDVNWTRFCSSVFRKVQFYGRVFRGIALRYLRIQYRAIGQPGGMGSIETTIRARHA